MGTDHPEVIAGHPAEVHSYRIGPFEIELVGVRDLSEILDRDRALLDETYVPPYWALVWAGARALAERLVCVPLRDRSVLDAGCGRGIVALTCARIGARVTAVDRDPAAIEFLRASAHRAGLEIDTIVGDVRDVCENRRFEEIAAAELLYDKAEMRSLAGCMAEALLPGGRLWIGDAHRVPTELFYDELARRRLSTLEDRSVRMTEEEAGRVVVRLAAFTRPGRSPRPSCSASTRLT
jgi:predicted nicotinamide N-methyase